MLTCARVFGARRFVQIYRTEKLNLNLTVARKMHHHSPIPNWHTVSVEGAVQVPLTCPREPVLFQEKKTQMRRIAIFAALFAVTVTARAADAATFESGGVKRTYTAVIPNTKPAPLVLILHGNTQQGEDMRTRTSWPEVATREGFVAVFPDGLNRAWADLRGVVGAGGRRASDAAGVAAKIRPGAIQSIGKHRDKTFARRDLGP